MSGVDCFRVEGSGQQRKRTDGAAKRTKAKRSVGRPCFGLGFGPRMEWSGVTMGALVGRSGACYSAGWQLGGM